MSDGIALTGAMRFPYDNHNYTKIHDAPNKMFETYGQQLLDEYRDCGCTVLRKKLEDWALTVNFKYTKNYLKIDL